MECEVYLVLFYDSLRPLAKAPDRILLEVVIRFFGGRQTI